MYVHPLIYLRKFRYTLTPYVHIYTCPYLHSGDHIIHVAIDVGEAIQGMGWIGLVPGIVEMALYSVTRSEL